MSTKITIINIAEEQVVIDIEGMIGVPEEHQFDDPDSRTATYEKFRAQAESIRRIKAREVVVNIRSTGGDVNDALLIHDALRSTGARITTRCYGYVASAATIIAQAADDSRREMSSNALYLIHNSACSCDGNSTELAKTIELLETTDRTIASIYATRSGRPVEDFICLMNKNNGSGRWLTPTEALEAALIDKIIESSPISNYAAEQIALQGLPALPDTKNEMKMNVTKRWRAILEILGLQSDAMQPLTESELDTIDNSILMSERELAELRNRVITLEAQNAKMNAAATATKPKEDPSASERKLSANANAYTEDVKGFKL